MLKQVSFPVRFRGSLAEMTHRNIEMKVKFVADQFGGDFDLSDDQADRTIRVKSVIDPIYQSVHVQLPTDCPFSEASVRRGIIEVLRLSLHCRYSVRVVRPAPLCSV